MPHSRSSDDRPDNIGKVAATGSSGMSHSSRYPYLVTRLSGAIYHIRQLPASPRQELIDFARERCFRLKFRCCVVLAPDDCVYVELDGTHSDSDQPPSGGFVHVGPLNIVRDGVRTGEVID